MNTAMAKIPLSILNKIGGVISDELSANDTLRKNMLITLYNIVDDGKIDNHINTVTTETKYVQDLIDSMNKTTSKRIQEKAVELQSFVKIF